MCNNKRLKDFTNLFSLNSFMKSDKIILEYFQHHATAQKLSQIHLDLVLGAQEYNNVSHGHLLFITSSH